MDELISSVTYSTIEVISCIESSPVTNADDEVYPLVFVVNDADYTYTWP